MSRVFYARYPTSSWIPVDLILENFPALILNRFWIGGTYTSNTIIGKRYKGKWISYVGMARIYRVLYARYPTSIWISVDLILENIPALILNRFWIGGTLTSNTIIGNRYIGKWISCVGMAGMSRVLYARYPTSSWISVDLILENFSLFIMNRFWIGGTLISNRILGKI